MNKLILSSLLVVIAAPAALAEDISCGETDQSQWLGEDVIKAKAAELGYDARDAEEEDGCWEVYALDKDGKKVELYFHPVTGELVGSKDAD